MHRSKYFIITGGLFSVVLVTLLLRIPSVTPALAKQIISDDLKVDLEDLRFVKFQYEMERGNNWQYDIMLQINSENYEYKIDVDTGDILSKVVTEKKMIDETPESAKISVNQAKAIALTDAELDNSEVTFHIIRFSEHKTVGSYELDFIANNSEYTYLINAETGAIITSEIDLDISMREKFGVIITVSDAKKIALDDAKVSFSDVVFLRAVTHQQLDNISYEFAFISNKFLYTYEICAQTSEIIMSQRSEYYFK